MTSSDLKRQLLADYLACLERLKAAEREHSEVLLTDSDDAVLRSAQRIEAMKAVCSAARARYEQDGQAESLLSR